jgi:AhpD family alkylhydroperoxidase
LSLPPLAAEVDVEGPASAAEKAAVDFAEQFSIDVTGISGDQRGRLLSALGKQAFSAVVLMFIADFAPRVLAGLDALGKSRPRINGGWDRTTDPADAVFNTFLPAVARQTALDPVTAEIVRLRGASQHQCRHCSSIREATALEAGGSEELYGDIASYDNSTRLTEAQKAALRYVDALIWSPGDIAPYIASGMLSNFSAEQAVEVTFDVMRNGANKVGVALGADAPKVEHGTARYRILADGQTRDE